MMKLPKINFRPNLTNHCLHRSRSVQPNPPMAENRVSFDLPPAGVTKLTCGDRDTKTTAKPYNIACGNEICPWAFGAAHSTTHHGFAF